MATSRAQGRSGPSDGRQGHERRRDGEKRPRHDPYRQCLRHEPRRRDAVHPEADDAKPEEQKPNGNAGPAAKFPLVPFDDLKPGTGTRLCRQGPIAAHRTRRLLGTTKVRQELLRLRPLMHVALGWQYRERRVQQGPVVYCAFEGAAGFHKRAEAFRRKHEVPPNVPFYLMPTRADLVTRPQGAHRRHPRSTGRAAVVCLDTLNRSLAGSESKDEDMARYIAAADAIREAFDCARRHRPSLRHRRQPAARPYLADRRRRRADRRQARRRRQRHRHRRMDEGRRRGRAASSAGLKRVEIGTDEDGDPITSCVVVPADGPPSPRRPEKRARMTKAAQTALRALREALSAGRRAGTCILARPGQRDGDDARSAGETMPTAWASRRPTPNRARNRRFSRATEYLIGGGIVAVWEPYVWIAR